MIIRKPWPETTSRPRRRWAQRVTLLMAAAWLARAVPAAAEDDTILVCGVPVQGHLAAGATDHYTPVASANRTGIVDIIDTSGTIGLLKMGNPRTDTTCSGSLLIDGSIVQPIEVSDCVGSDAGDYTIELINIQQGADNCGRRLTCGVAPVDTRFEVPGEVDPFLLTANYGEQLSFTASMPGADEHALRLRLFGPSGEALLDSCSGTSTVMADDTGTFTLLVSSCVTPLTGAYSVTWNTLPACPAVPKGQFLYIGYVAPYGVAVVDAATRQTVSFIPLEPQFIETPPTPGDGYVRVMPNGAFAIATFESASSIHVIDTAANRSVGTISMPIATNARDIPDIVFAPDGTLGYGISAPARGVLIINMITKRVAARIPIPIDPDREELTFAKLAISHDGRQLYVVTPTLLLHVVDVATRAVVATIPLDPTYEGFEGPPVRLIASADGATLFALFPSALLVIDLATQNLDKSVSLKGPGIGRPTDMVVSADGRTAYVAANQLLVVDTTVPSITATIPDLSDAWRIALSPDGARLYVTNPDGGPVLEVDLQSRQIVGGVNPVGEGTSASGIATTAPPTGLCVGDDQGETRVTVGELVTSVNYAADGCPLAMSPVAQQSSLQSKEGKR